jgi:hypothetical protein
LGNEFRIWLSIHILNDRVEKRTQLEFIPSSALQMVEEFHHMLRCLYHRPPYSVNQGLSLVCSEMARTNEPFISYVTCPCLELMNDGCNIKI